MKRTEHCPRGDSMTCGVMRWAYPRLATDISVLKQNSQHPAQWLGRTPQQLIADRECA